MSAINDGGPAFPEAIAIGPSGDIYPGMGGMALRDWFAGQALAGMLAQSHQGPKDWTQMGHGWGEDCVNGLNKHETAISHTLADFAYKIADAMLAERSKP